MAIEGGARGRVTLFSSTEEASLALWQPTIDVAAAAQPSAIVLVDQRSSGRASLQHGTVRAGGRPLGINGTVFVGDMQLGGSQLVRGR
jgi:hypothetical protein